MHRQRWEGPELNFASVHPPQSVAFGMGGGLLQKVNRDTMSFATKLSHIVYADGTAADIMKATSSKPSLPGALAVKRVRGIPTAFPADSGEVAPQDNLLQTVYDCRPLKVGRDSPLRSPWPCCCCTRLSSSAAAWL